MASGASPNISLELVAPTAPESHPGITQAAREPNDGVQKISLENATALSNNCHFLDKVTTGVHVQSPDAASSDCHSFAEGSSQCGKLSSCCGCETHPSKSVCAERKPPQQHTDTSVVGLPPVACPPKEHDTVGCNGTLYDGSRSESNCWPTPMDCKKTSSLRSADSLRFLSPITSRDPAVRTQALDTVERSLDSWLVGYGSPPGDQASTLHMVQQQLPDLLRLSQMCPFEEVRDRCSTILEDLKVTFDEYF